MELAVHRLLPASVAAMGIVVPVIALFFFLQIGAARARQAAPTNNAANNEYVGSQVCAECHRAIYSVFSETDMGRSMSTVSPELLGRFPKSAQVLDTKLNRRFEISVRDGSLFQTDYEIGPDGKEIFRDTQKVEWIIGAGANGFGAIVRRGNVLFEAPLSFYSSTQHWNLSPGYESYDFGFSRPILPACIVCHSGRPRPIPDGNGAFLEPPFQQLAVGCENCHGPGGIHARRMKERTSSFKADDGSIVNPAKLPSWLADNICASCHQTGDARVLKPGKNFQDFRPGSALDDTVALLMIPPKRGAPSRGDLLEHYFSMTLS